MDEFSKLLAVQWEDIRRRLLYEFGGIAFHKYIHPIEIIDFDAGVLSLSAPKELINAFCEREYFDRMLELWQETNIDVLHLSIFWSNRGVDAQGLACGCLAVVTTTATTGCFCTRVQREPLYAKKLYCNEFSHPFPR